MDSRPVPISCHVQIKAIWAGNRKISLRLSSVERLAKDPKPALIYVIVMGLDLAPKAAYLFHLTKKPLEKILTRLRKEHKKYSGTAAINKKFISFSISLGSEISTTGKAFKNAVEVAVGGPLALQDYIARKREELANLGYNDASYTGSMRLKAADIDEFVDAFLGIQSIEFTKMEHFETRFGITLPVFEFNGQAGKMTVSPTEPKLCRLVCRNGTSEAPSILEGEIRVPGIPGLPPEHIRMLFRHPLFDMTIPFSNGQNFDLKGSEEGWKVAHLPKVWFNFFRMLRFLSEPGAILQFQAEGLPQIEFCNNGAEGAILAQDNQQIENVAQRICYALEHVAVDRIEVSWAELFDSREDINYFLAVLQDDLNDAYLKLSTDAVLDPPESATPCHLFYIFPLGGIFVAYSVHSTITARTEDGATDWELKLLRLGEVTSLTDPERGLQNFQTRIMERTSINNAITLHSKRIRSVATSSD